LNEEGLEEQYKDSLLVRDGSSSDSEDSNTPLNPLPFQENYTNNYNKFLENAVSFEQKQKSIKVNKFDTGVY
jgi:hypothetical protein